MTESIIQPEPFHKELKQKLSYFVLSSLSIFLNTKTNVATNLRLFNCVNHYFSLLLDADPISLSCSSGSK